MPIVYLALKSILNRKFTAALTVLAIALSVTLLLGVERLRTEARASFANTISGVDLVVGARSGAVQLLLYAVFRIGNATNNITWQSYQDIAGRPKIKWTVPISLGDSHLGYRVMGTTPAYFEHYRYARDRKLTFAAGERFADVYDAVLGAEVAEDLGYTLGQEIVIAHGAGKVSFALHDDKPFRVVGILNRTGTPVDRTVHVSLEGIEAIHIDWQSGAPIPGLKVSPEHARRMDLTPKAITAFLVGLESKIGAFQVQRDINEYRQEPLLAILPGVALQELWDLMSVAEQALLAVSTFVVLVGLTGMLTVILASLNERRREMAIMRSVGARPAHVFALIIGEAGGLTLIGTTLGLALLYLGLIVAQPILESRFGLFIGIRMISSHDLQLLGLVIAAGFLIGVVPAYRAYRYSLADGMTIRL
jgi:putative ABC transport system permease protein